MIDQNAPKVTEPDIGSLHNPTALITPQSAPIIIESSLILFR
jgi:hypothetical protein